MNLYLILGRVFLGLCLIGIGVLHFFFPGIRPIILPDSTHIPIGMYWIVYLIAILLVGFGVLVLIGKKLTAISFIVGIVFFLLFLFGHLPAFLSADQTVKLKYWTNLNKMLALSGGFLILAAMNAPKNRFTKSVLLLGRCFFACMLLLFGIGHLLSTTALSTLVPGYIPFKKFWTFAGGIILVGSAISFFINFKVKEIAFVLAITLSIWLVSLHLYYTILFPDWQEGENFIGSLTCLAFCGIALLISQSLKASPAATARVIDK